MKTNILTLVITLAVGIILAGSLLGPVISDAQNTIGPEVTLTNDSTVVLRTVENGDVLEVTRTIDGDDKNDVWTLNGESVIGPTGTADRWNVAIMSDGIYARAFAPSNAAVGDWVDIAENGTANSLSVSSITGGSYSFTFQDGNITLVKDESDTPLATVPYTWAYVACPYGEGEYCAALENGAALINDPTQVILCGIYTTGELDTVYYRINGADYVGNENYSMITNVVTTLHEGTTDIYDATVSVSISENDTTESFTPYRILVPYEITGHEAGGASYTLLGAIPVMVIVVLLMAAVGAIALRRAD